MGINRKGGPGTVIYGYKFFRMIAFSACFLNAVGCLHQGNPAINDEFAAGYMLFGNFSFIEFYITGIVA